MNQINLIKYEIQRFINELEHDELATHFSGQIDGLKGALIIIDRVCEQEFLKD